MEQPKKWSLTKYRWAGTLGVLLFLIGYGVYAQIVPTIRANVSINDFAVGGLTRNVARERLAARLGNPDEQSVTLVVEHKDYPIPGPEVGLQFNADEAVERAWGVGRSGSVMERVTDLLLLAFEKKRISVSVNVDHGRLRDSIRAIKAQIDEPGKDIRLRIVNGNIAVLTDTKIGFVLDEDAALHAILAALAQGEYRTPSLSLTVTKPTVAADQGAAAQEKAERVLATPLSLTHSLRTFRNDRAALGSWIITKPNGPSLDVTFDETKISAYVTTLAQELNAEPQAPRVTVSDGKVVEFLAPRSGRALDQGETIRLITDALAQRRDSTTEITELSLPVKVEHPNVTDQSASELGIVELIGSASTRFTGSPANRISNIKNGVKFLTGILVKPGEEFSTLAALGTVDNTTGYLPELVIKENRTIPEYGGGLCQVSTTLFRAALNAGLPITARQNHSYRVIYYERDGDGSFIGPGLDATIYNPAPDFRFLNDTKANILIQGHVEGDKITFDFYGTRDNRTSKVDGPQKLTETPAGDPIYIETDTLKPGERKQIEKPHPGGTATATYTVTYADGTVKEQIFKSFYRSWPAQFLVGIDPTKATTTPSLTPLQ